MTSSPLPLPCEMLMKNGRGYKNNLKHVIYLFLYLFFTQAAIGPSSIQIYQDNNHFIGNYQICA